MNISVSDSLEICYSNPERYVGSLGWTTVTDLNGIGFNVTSLKYGNIPIPLLGREVGEDFGLTTSPRTIPPATYPGPGSHSNGGGIHWPFGMFNVYINAVGGVNRGDDVYTVTPAQYAKMQTLYFKIGGGESRKTFIVGVISDQIWQ